MPTSLLHLGQRLALRASFNLVRGRKTMPTPYKSVIPLGQQQVIFNRGAKTGHQNDAFLRALRLEINTNAKHATDLHHQAAMDRTKAH